MEEKSSYDVFISYRWVDPDSTWVRESLAPALEKAGIRVVLDVKDFEPGHDLLLEMTRANTTSRHVLCILSPDYFEGNRMVSFEALMARRLDPKGEGHVIPLLFRESTLPEWIRGIVPVDWTNPESRDREWKKLLRTLGAPNHDVLPPGDALNPLSRLAQQYLDRILAEQGPYGDWISSVSTTAAVIAVLSEGDFSASVYSAVQLGTAWLRRVQAPDGAWGRYRSRTIDEDMSRARLFEPDWPHTIYAVWASLLIESDKQPDFARAADWLKLHVAEERARNRFWADVDILVLANLAAQRDVRPIVDLISELQIDTGGTEVKVFQSRSPAPISIKTLYRYVKHTGLAKVDLELRRELAREIERTYHCLDPSSYLRSDFLIAANFNTTALRILLFLDPEEYVEQARNVAELIGTEGIQKPNIVSDLNIYSLILQLSPPPCLSHEPPPRLPADGGGERSLE